MRLSIYNPREDYKGVVNHVKNELYEKVKVKASGIARGDFNQFISRKKIELWTTSESFSWFGIDFGEERRVIAQAYSFRCSYPDYAPRSWVLQATNSVEAFKAGRELDDSLNPKLILDNPDWTNLSVVQNDTGFDNQESRLFKMDDKGTSFRAFRIVQMQKNKSNNPDENLCFAVSGFELYGKLEERMDSHKEIAYRYEKDFDTNGIIYDLGLGIQSYSSPLEEGTLDYFLSREDVIVRTTNKKFSWFALDFGEHRQVSPTNYTMCVASDDPKMNYSAPTNWYDELAS